MQTSNRGVSAIGSSAAAGEAAAASSLRRCRFNDKRGSHSRHGPIRGRSRNGLRMDYENRVYTMLADHGRFHKSHPLASLAVSALSCNTQLGGFLLRLKTTLVDQTSEGPSSRCTTAPSSRRNSAASHSFGEPGEARWIGREYRPRAVYKIPAQLRTSSGALRCIRTGYEVRMQQSAAHSAGIAHNRQALPSQVPRQAVSSDGYQKPGENLWIQHCPCPDRHGSLALPLSSAGAGRAMGKLWAFARINGTS